MKSVYRSSISRVFRKQWTHAPKSVSFSSTSPSFRTTGDLFERVKKRDPDQPEFLQAVKEVLNSLEIVLDSDPAAMEVMERLVEPERQVVFRVPWMDDKGNLQVNRGFRVQFNSAIGPYKGGCRFHPSVNLSVIKFLGFEQCFKNSLTGLQMGGGKGGSDFDPKGKSDKEVMKFCQSFMTELYRHIGARTDVPAGDIGVGAREVGYMFGQYKRLTNRFEGVFTGKGLEYGGSLIRPEATGYGVVTFLNAMVEDKKQTLEGKRVLVSGSGNVAQFAVQKLLRLGAKVLTMSDSSGTLYFEDGMSFEDWAQISQLKNVKRGRISDYLGDSNKAKFLAGEKPWNIPADIAVPCATQNEILENDAQALASNGVKYVAEGANLPSDLEAIEVFLKEGIYYGPAKACNAGGVGTSGLEMSQNFGFQSWSARDVEGKLDDIMLEIFRSSKTTAEEYGQPDNLMLGSNIFAFQKIKNAMIAQGYV